MKNKEDKQTEWENELQKILMCDPSAKIFDGKGIPENTKFILGHSMPDVITQFISSLLKAERERVLEDFAEYCHEYYKGFVMEEDGEYLYQYTSQVSEFIDDFLKLKEQ